MRWKKHYTLCGFEGAWHPRQVSGDDSGGDTPVPISNTAVKPSSADGTRRATARESRTSPENLAKALRASTLGAFAFSRTKLLNHHRLSRRDALDRGPDPIDGEFAVSQGLRPGQVTREHSQQQGQ
jgi:hypothetical protein